MNVHWAFLTSTPPTLIDCFQHVLGLRVEVCVRASCVAAWRGMCIARRQRRRWGRWQWRNGHLRPWGADQPAGAGGCSTSGQGRLPAAAEPQLPTAWQEPDGELEGLIMSFFYFEKALTSCSGSDWCCWCCPAVSPPNLQRKLRLCGRCE